MGSIIRGQRRIFYDGKDLDVFILGVMVPVERGGLRGKI